jgi:hypothetical protein
MAVTQIRGHQWARKWIPEQNHHPVKVVGKDDMEELLTKGCESTTRKHWWHYATIDSLNSYLNKRSGTLDRHEHHDTKQGAKCDGTHKMSAHDSGYVDENENLALVNRRVVASKSSFDSTVAASALIATTFGMHIYELSVICISTVATASLSPAQPHQSESGIHLWHIRFNLFDCVLLTALVVATTLTVVSLFLGRDM